MNLARRRPGDTSDLATGDEPVDFGTVLIRPRDMLHLGFSFINLRLRPGSSPAVLERRVAAPAYIVVIFQPQSVAEEAFFQSDPTVDNSDSNAPPVPGEDPLKAPPVPARLAGTSRLAFRLPDSMDTVRFDADALLDWVALEPSLVPVALPPGTGGAGRQIAIPHNYQTAVEAPWRLFLSPDNTGTWVHAAQPVEHRHPTTNQLRAELWHTRLAVRSGSVIDERGATPHVRAVWTPGYDVAQPPSSPATDEVPFRTSLTPRDRYELVRLTSDYSLPSGANPVRVNRLMLTSLGAHLDLRGAWDPPLSAPPDGLTTAEWRHRSTLGRDAHVRVVYQGFLMPFGHRASLVKVTERQVQRIPQPGPNAGHTAAYLRQRTFVVVREPEKVYPVQGQASGGRGMPFKRVRLTTLVTPNLVDPSADSSALVAGVTGSQAFWPQVSVPGHAQPQDFRFHAVAEDEGGQRTEFAVPLCFVRGNIGVGNGGAVSLPAARTAFNGAANLGRRRVALSQQKVAFAPHSPDAPGNTTLPADSMVFKVHAPVGAVPTGTPKFFPTMEKAQVRLPAAEFAAGKTDLAGGLSTEITLHPAYLASEFDPDANKGAVWAQLTDALPLGFSAGSAGGVATPNMAIGGLSRALGPVGGNLADLVGGTFNPSTFFAAVDGVAPSILGGVRLWDILSPIVSGPSVTSATSATSATSVGGSWLDKLPKMTNEFIYPNGDTSELPVAVQTKLEWNPSDLVKQDPLGIFQPHAGNPTALSLSSTTVTRFDGTAPTFHVAGTLTNFCAQLLGTAAPFLRITFDSLAFRSATGQKPDVDVRVREVAFAGVLEFVNVLKDYMRLGNGLLDGGAPSLRAAPRAGPEPGAATAMAGSVARAVSPLAQDADVGHSGGGLSVDVTAQGITARFGVALPALAVGVFTLQNVALSAALNIPFSGEPARVRFGFASPESPFNLTASLFGGGGFFLVDVGLDGVERLHLALEFGASCSIDLGVASGSVSVMGGVEILMISSPKEQADLTGYVRLSGEMDVLGLISVSLEFNLSLTYSSAGGTPEVWGQATLTVEVDVTLFSTCVEITMERRFAGGGGSSVAASGTLASARAAALPAPATGLRIADLFSQEDWVTYSLAFAG